MSDQSKKRKASQNDLWEMVPSDLTDEDDIKEIPITKNIKRIAVLQRYSAYQKTLNARVQFSTAASTSAESEAKPSLSFLEKHSTQMIDIYVGEEKILFRVYKDTLCNKIEFFDRMFNGKFKEANENAAVLPEDDPEAFDMLIFRKKLHLWVLADKLCLANLQDYVMNIWRGEDKIGEIYYTAEEFQYIFGKTASKSPPRQYAARMLRFQSLKRPTVGREYLTDSYGEPIPLSGVDVTALTELLAKDKEMLESYLELAGRTNDLSGNEMDPRVMDLY
ncbi:uncharacterized protein EAE97_005451 [Botrytis byssoidea]|uniref:BTB domain-containing protein n=1 Tax=Botrytis byssoidea TaxID=139641 RepID=A0A9P5IMU0_9HELO|nr:uncharacterized protein EAE97_005451 [Botrytis byssoidea]KAF7944818.1 hypothetical protein EAE97_005451 [Botrytis byssoidea]